MARRWRAFAGIGVVAILLGAAGCSNGASRASTLPVSATVSAHSGTIRLFESARVNNRASVVVTGVIADSGKSIPTDRNGNAKQNGSYEELILHHGSIRLDDRSILNRPPVAHFNSDTCSGALHTKGKVQVLSGTGSYAGISGSINDRINAGFDLPRHDSGPKKGHCAGIGTATAYFSFATGVGSVAF